MEYKLTDKELNRVKISEDKKALSLDITLKGLLIDEKIEIPFTEGMTVNIATPSGLIEEIDRIILEYFSNKYKNK